MDTESERFSANAAALVANAERERELDKWKRLAVFVCFLFVMTVIMMGGAMKWISDTNERTLALVDQRAAAEHAQLVACQDETERLQAYVTVYEAELAGLRQRAQQAGLLQTVVGLLK